MSAYLLGMPDILPEPICSSSSRRRSRDSARLRFLSCRTTSVRKIPRPPVQLNSNGPSNLRSRQFAYACPERSHCHCELIRFYAPAGQSCDRPVILKFQVPSYLAMSRPSFDEPFCVVGSCDLPFLKERPAAKARLVVTERRRPLLACCCPL
jgi:hypothetical protein